MKVETYEIEEITGELGNMAADSEAIELCERLGLEGQKKLVNHETGTRLPYPKLTNVQAVVFEAICPTKTRLEQYEGGIIPLRVLQVAAHCKELGLFEYLEVWHPADAKLDPVLIGCMKDPISTWPYHHFLLARWGEVWKEFDVLILEAKEIIKARLRVQLLRVQSEIASALASVDEIADEIISSGNDKRPYVSGI